MKKEEVYEAALAYFKGDSLAADVWTSKYALKDGDTYLEKTPDDTHKRLASEFARIEKEKFEDPLTYDDIYPLFQNFKYIVPQGSPLYGIGNNFSYHSLGNCFTLGEHPYDSYGGILYADQMLVQLCKRRCVGKGTKVIVNDWEIKNIEDVKLGDMILSFNVDENVSEFKQVLYTFKSDVKKSDRIVIKNSAGGILRTSKTHPILTLDKKLVYKNAGKLQVGDTLISPDNQVDHLLNYSKSLEKIGWWIGCHIGDGSADLQPNQRVRFRNVGDNEDVIKEYGQITNRICKASCNHRLSSREDYQSNVWEYSHCSKKAREVCKLFLDSQLGSKVYTAKIPSFISENNLWIPFIAGLIDSDGFVRDSHTIQIRLCAKNVIVGLSEKLSSLGIRAYYSEIEPTKENEETQYSLTIHSDNYLYTIIGNLVVNSYKRTKILEQLREWSNTIKLTDVEIFNIVNNYENQKYSTNRYDKATITQRKNKANLAASIRFIKKKCEIGIGGLNSLLKHNIVDWNKYCEILQRKTVVSIENDLSTTEYYDLSVEDNHNFYAGDNSFVLTHNCGVGLCLDKIRPKGMPTRNAAVTTDGIGVFMERFSNSTREVAQHGRRGALMQGLAVEHPEIETFINIKRDRTKVTGANISVILSEQFMEAVKNNGTYTQQWPIDSAKPEVSYDVNAQKIWDQIIDAAWESAEPGILFRDNARKYSLSHPYGTIDGRFLDIITNPCGEIWIGLDSCRLMVINLFSYVRHPFTRNAFFDMETFRKHAEVAQRLMDDMVDLEREKMQKIIYKIKTDPEPNVVKQVELDMWTNYLEVAELGRRTGLGITGLGDCLAAMGVVYGSQESVEKTEEIYKELAVHSMISSCQMAKELGPFPLYDKSIEKDNLFLARLFEASPKLKRLHNKYGRRNISLTTTAPAGSISILTQTTSGIEPAFALEYQRSRKVGEDEKVKDAYVDDMGDRWTKYKVYHHHYKTWMDTNDCTDIKKSPYWGGTANDVDWKVSVELQAAAQRWISHSISKTCNVPKETPKELIAEIYMTAYDKECKGFTVYRDGCRDGVLNNIDEGFAQEQVDNRPKVVDCEVHHHSVKTKPYFVLVGTIDDKPYEVFAGKNGFIDKKCNHGRIERLGKPKCYRAVLDDETVIQPITMCCNEDEEALTRMVSIMLRHGTPINVIVDQLEKVQGDMNSFARAISRALKKHIPNGTSVDTTCPECGQRTLIRQDGCTNCQNCGFSGCS